MPWRTTAKNEGEYSAGNRPLPLTETSPFPAHFPDRLEIQCRHSAIGDVIRHDHTSFVTQHVM